ncbi:larval cuticle protein LCP-22-like [Drosophila eugracilis]|uniref:larval cuticle protein LCP-22-like n=1 Tax=Drosophila eugracilis TaxID=29029 RepID=UPI0007E8194F|nr:larval cuticle protein LCP-22-like [Drosophila eugracilis]
MKFLIVFVALFALALAAPADEATILKSVSDVGPESFSYGWATSDGQEAEAAGELKNAGSENEALAVRGSYSYIGNDGVTYTVTYIADENGFQPQGAHLPVAPVAEAQYSDSIIRRELFDNRRSKHQPRITMKFLIVFVALFAVALAAPADEVKILKSVSDVGPEHFSYESETSDGSKAQAVGDLANRGTDNEALVIKGFYSFVADDGQTYTVNYIADENGFQPQGAHLPVAPEA